MQPKRQANDDECEADQQASLQGQAQHWVMGCTEGLHSTAASVRRVGSVGHKPPAERSTAGRGSWKLLQ